MSIHINSAAGTNGEGFESFIFNGGVSSATIANQNVIHSEILALTKFNDRGKKPANHHMTREAKAPSILTENGFINNPVDAAKLKQDSFLDKIAQGHVIGLVKAFGLKQKEGVTMSELNEAQEKVRQEAIRLGITDGKDPFKEVNQWYVWSSMIPLARRIEELEKKNK